MRRDRPQPIRWGVAILSVVLVGACSTASAQSSPEQICSQVFAALQSQGPQTVEDRNGRSSDLHVLCDLRLVFGQTTLTAAAIVHTTLRDPADAQRQLRIASQFERGRNLPIGDGTYLIVLSDGRLGDYAAKVLIATGRRYVELSLRFDRGGRGFSPAARQELDAKTTAIAQRLSSDLRQ